MTTPTVLLIPGLWEGPTIYHPLTTLLPYPTQTFSLPSTGTHSPGNPTMRDDETAIRSALKKLVEEEEKEVVMVMHSAGGFLGSAAVEGLGRKERVAKGLRGGVGKLVFLAAGVADVGFEHVDLPFMDMETGKEKGEMYCLQPRSFLFNDLPPNETDKWISNLQSQPLTGWNVTITYAGWKEIPSVYLICENDQIIPAELQENMATMIGAKVERCKSGHMVMLSMPERVAEVIKGAVEEE